MHDMNNETHVCLTPYYHIHVCFLPLLVSTCVKVSVLLNPFSVMLLHSTKKLSVIHKWHLSCTFSLISFEKMDECFTVFFTITIVKDNNIITIIIVYMLFTFDALLIPCGKFRPLYPGKGHSS